MCASVTFGIKYYNLKLYCLVLAMWRSVPCSVTYHPGYYLHVSKNDRFMRLEMTKEWEEESQKLILFAVQLSTLSRSSTICDIWSYFAEQRCPWVQDASVYRSVPHNSCKCPHSKDLRMNWEFLLSSKNSNQLPFAFSRSLPPADLSLWGESTALVVETLLLTSADIISALSTF